MTTSGNTGTEVQFGRTKLALSRYDLLLAVIPSVFALALLVGLVLSVPIEIALLPAGMIGAIVLADALFLNPPVNGHGGA